MGSGKYWDLVEREKVKVERLKDKVFLTLLIKTKRIW